jgi:hypothetical protein
MAVPDEFEADFGQGFWTVGRSARLRACGGLVAEPFLIQKR